MVALKKVHLKKPEDGIPNSALRFASEVFGASVKFYRSIRSREIKALQESEENHHVGIQTSVFRAILHLARSFCRPQVVKLREMFPHGPGFVLVFDYMLSDLSSVIRNTGTPLTEVGLSISQVACSLLQWPCMCMQAQIKSYMMMLLRGVAYLHGNSIMHRV